MTRLQFGPDDEDQYFATRDRLLEEYGEWLQEHRDASDDDRDLAADATILLDWRWNYSSGELDRFDPSDLHEFLVGHCPRKVSAPPEFIGDIVAATKGFVEFMSSTDRLVGGASSAARLMMAADELIPTAMEAMGDPSNFGMAKSMFGGSLSDPGEFDSEEELQAYLDKRVEEFNALPYEERKALTDPGFATSPQLQELPFIHVRPPAEDVEASAAEAPVLDLFERLRDHIGEKGAPLTSKGNLKLADARALVELLGTDDIVDPDFGSRTFKTTSSEELQELTFLVEWAKDAGAVRVVKGRMVPVKAWAGRSPLQNAERCFEQLLDPGPLFRRFRYSSMLDEVDDLFDSGVLHWLTMLLPAGAEIPFDTLEAMAAEEAREQLGDVMPAFLLERLEGTVTRQLSSALNILHTAGVLAWPDRRQEQPEHGRPVWVGGNLHLTPLGHHVVPSYVERIGFTLRTLDDPTTVTADELVEILAGSALDPTDIAPRWRADEPDQERVAAVVDAIVQAPSAERRLNAVRLLRCLDRDEIAAPYVRQLLDSPVAGHAAMYLLEQGLADPDDIGSFLDEAPLIDLLSTLVDEPDTMCDMFLRAVEATGDGEHLLGQMWRHPMPETLEVLQALGQHLPDKRLAKVARKSVMQHRSHMANPGR
ncbi:MAG: hypothetical protein WD225_10530 [Ilumatobacteraceae bacterium]